MSKEKGVLQGVFCSSVVVVLATAFVCLLAKVFIFIRCFRSSCAANTSVGFPNRKSSILCRNSQCYSRQAKRHSSCRGVSLIEVLVTLVVLSVGLLGMAAMQVRAMQMNQSAYMRSQAVSLSQDMADRMRINWQAATDGNYEVTLAADRDDFKKADGVSDQLKLAKKDIHDWLTFIQDSLPAGDGSISQADDRFTITVCWDDSRGQGTQPSQLACGVDGLESNVLEVTL